MRIELVIGVCGSVISLLLALCAYFLAKTQERNEKAATAVEAALPRYEEKFSLITQRIADMNREISIISQKFEQVAVLRERVAVLESQQNGIQQALTQILNQVSRKEP